MKKSWYDDLDDEQINQLKNNWSVFCMLTPWAEMAFRLMPKQDRQVLTLDGRWIGSSCDFDQPGQVYRLHPDWQRPEPEKKGHWEECDVRTGPKPDPGFVDFGEPCFPTYWFSRQVVDESSPRMQRFVDYDLHQAFSMVGFGGIQFKELSDEFFYECGLEEKGKPRTPAKVRFWVE